MPYQKEKPPTPSLYIFNHDGGHKRSIALSKTFQNLISSPDHTVTVLGSVFARSFNANAQIRESEDDHDIDVDSRSSDKSISRRNVDGFLAYISDCRCDEPICTMNGDPFDEHVGLDV